VAGCTLLDYSDAGLAAIPQAELAAQVTKVLSRHDADRLLVFDDTGVTGHGDHKAATAAAVAAARREGLPVLAWTIPAAVAGQLRAETGAPFTGRTADRVDLCVWVDRGRQRRAALLHASHCTVHNTLRHEPGVRVELDS
jgi:LmbE family N-acetylglucosaminyl deacetylase